MPARRRVDRPSTPAARPRTAVPTRPRRRTRRGFHPAFMVLATVVVTALVAAAVSLSAMLVQASFRTEELRARIAESADRGEVLAGEVAELSSPFRVAAWAQSRGMVTADDVVALTIDFEGAR